VKKCVRLQHTKDRTMRRDLPVSTDTISSSTTTTTPSTYVI